MLDFLAYLELERGLSRNTLEAYRSDLLQFGEFLERRGADACWRARTATSPRSWPSSPPAPAERAAGRRRRTLARKVACLRSFYRHLRREGMIEHDPTAELRGPRKPQRLPRVLSREEVARLLRAAAAAPTPLAAARPRAARADVRVRAARLRGRRAGARRRRPRGGPAVRARQGLQGAARADRPPGARRGARPTAAAGARRCSATGAQHASCSSTAAAAALTRQGLYKIVQGHARSAGLERADEPAHAAPHASPRTCSPAAATCARCRRCSATPTSPRRRSTRTSPPSA